jgi:short-subunit dehydrogenase
MAYSTAGKRVLITGASSGVGAALARALAEQGAVVGLIARRRGRLAEVLADCRRVSPASTMWVADLADSAAVGPLALQAWDVLGGIDVLVNNAAIPKRRTVIALDPDEVEAVMRVNFFAPVRLALAVLPRMLECGAGVIVNVSSVGGRLGIIHESAYSASKFALCGWSEIDGRRPARHRGFGEADRARPRRHRDLGPAGQRRPDLRRSQVHARRGGAGHHRCPGQ